MFITEPIHGGWLATAFSQWRNSCLCARLRARLRVAFYFTAYLMAFLCCCFSYQVNPFHCVDPGYLSSGYASNGERYHYCGAGYAVVPLCFQKSLDVSPPPKKFHQDCCPGYHLHQSSHMKSFNNQSIPSFKVL